MDVVENLSMKELTEFLNDHPLTKIIIIINTHSLDKTGHSCGGGTNGHGLKNMLYVPSMCMRPFHAI